MEFFTNDKLTLIFQSSLAPNSIFPQPVHPYILKKKGIFGYNYSCLKS